MSKSLDNLSKAVDNTLKTESGTVITKDAIIDLIDSSLGELYNVTQFFTAIEDSQSQLQGWLTANLKNTNLKSIALYNRMASMLTATARSTMLGRFVGAMSDTANALIIIMEEVSGNLEKFFVEKNMTIYNTKISQVAIFGMIENSKMFAEFCVKYVEQLMSDRNPKLDKPERYVGNYLDENVSLACDLMNRVLNNKLSKTFVSAIMRYRNGGSDTSVVSGDKPSVQFARVNSDVTDSDISAGARGFKIFRWIGNFVSDLVDARYRKKVALRDQLQARARLLQLELAEEDESSPEYQRLLKIIANYQKQIDRLNQKIAKYEGND